MTDLERRALLGDREAQEECTKAGYAIACPICGGKPFVRESGADGLVFKTIRCCIEIKKITNTPTDWALKLWNTRVAPPVGRCGTCRWFADNNRGEWYGCKMCNAILAVPEDAPKANAFCSDYEPEDNRMGHSTGQKGNQNG